MLLCLHNSEMYRNNYLENLEFQVEQQITFGVGGFTILTGGMSLEMFD